jgi:hypothetical protein
MDCGTQWQSVHDSRALSHSIPHKSEHIWSSIEIFTVLRTFSARADAQAVSRPTPYTEAMSAISCRSRFSPQNTATGYQSWQPNTVFLRLSV